MNSQTMRVQSLPIKDIGYEALPLTILIEEKIRNIKREKILEDAKNNVSKVIYNIRILKLIMKLI